MPNSNPESWDQQRQREYEVVTGWTDSGQVQVRFGYGMIVVNLWPEAARTLGEGLIGAADAAAAAVLRQREGEV